MTLDHIELHSKFQKTAHLLVNNSPKYKCKFRDMMIIREDLQIDFFAQTVFWTLGGAGFCS